MAKLVIGTTKTNAVPAVVKEVIVPPSLGTKTVTVNGTYNASSDNYDGYSSVTVSVPSVSEPYLELGVLPNGNLMHSRTTSRLVQLSGFTGIGQHVLAYAYYYNTNITGTATFSDLTSILGESACLRMFSNSTITGFSAPNLKTISANNACEYMFSSSKVTTVDLSALESVAMYYTCRNMFSNSALSSIDFSSLESISGTNTFNNAFSSCLYLTSISFPKLDSITASDAFYQAFVSSGIMSISFGALKSTSFGSNTDQFRDMLSGVTDCMIHFPMNLNPALGSTVISSLTGYPDFGGTHTQLSFDLPATEN